MIKKYNEIKKQNFFYGQYFIRLCRGNKLKVKLSSVQVKNKNKRFDVKWI